MGEKDKPALQRIGDGDGAASSPGRRDGGPITGEGGQADIATDRVETGVAGQKFVQEPPGERPEPGEAEAATFDPTGESEESALAGNPRPRSQRQQGDED